MRKSWIIVALLLLGIQASAQEPDQPNTRAIAVGPYFHSFGLGLDFRYYFLKDSKTDLMIAATFASHRTRSERKIESAYKDQGGKDYTFDKKNYAYTLAPVFGITRQIIPKSEFNRISLRASLAGGPTLMILKPYYIEVAIPFSPTQATVEVDRYDGSKYNFTNIVGQADYFLGLNELSVVPGIRAQGGIMVDFSNSEDYIRGIGIGINAEYFFQEPEILDLNSNQRLFLGVSMSLLIGNSW